MLPYVPSVERVDLSKRRSLRGAKLTIEPGPLAAAPLYKYGCKCACTLRRSKREWSWSWPGPRQAHSHLPVESQAADTFVHSLEISANCASTRPVHDVQLQNGPTHLPSALNPTDGIVAVVYNPFARFGKLSVCYPGGELKNELFITHFLSSPNARLNDRRRSRQVRGTRPAEVFRSSIRQISTSAKVSTHRLDGASTALLVRVRGATFLCAVTPNHALVPPTDLPPSSVRCIGELPESLTDNLEHMDIALDHFMWGRAAIVDECGGLWLWWEEKVRRGRRTSRTTKLLRVRQASDLPSSSGDTFHKVIFGHQRDTVLLVSRKYLVEVNLSGLPGEATSNVILTLSDDSVFTSIAKTTDRFGSKYYCLTTCKELIWVDADSNTIVLRWLHDAGGQKALDIKASVIASSAHDVVALNLPSHSFSIAVETSRRGRFRMVRQPWTSPALSNVAQCCSLAPLPPVTTSEGNLSLAILEDDGTISLTNLEAPATNRVGQHPWRAAAGGRCLAPSATLPDLSLATLTPVEFPLSCGRWVWSYIREPDSRILNLSELRRQLREDDSQLDYISTGGEVVRDVAYGEPSELRANLLRPIQAPWCSDIIECFENQRSPFACRRLPHVDTLQHPNHGRCLDFPSRPALAGERLRLESDVALDTLLLCSESMPSGNTSAPVSSDELFAAVTSQLSLEDNRPTNASILRPRPSHADIGESDMDSATLPLCPSFQPLLDEWIVGRNPGAYEWFRPAEQPLLGSSGVTSRPVRPLPTGRVATGVTSQTGIGESALVTETIMPVLPLPSPTAVRANDDIVASLHSPAASLPRSDSMVRGARRKAAKKRQGGF